MMVLLFPLSAVLLGVGLGLCAQEVFMMLSKRMPLRLSVVVFTVGLTSSIHMLDMRNLKLRRLVFALGEILYQFCRGGRSGTRWRLQHSVSRRP
jgi:hypothetical protein